MGSTHFCRSLEQLSDDYVYRSSTHCTSCSIIRSIISIRWGYSVAVAVVTNMSDFPFDSIIQNDYIGGIMLKQNPWSALCRTHLRVGPF